MRLLITTQKVDKTDSVLGFFHVWIIEFTKHFDEILVICLEEGPHNLPENVRVISLGKEYGDGRIARTVRFLKIVWHERKNYDTVFVHMNPEYIVLAGLFWRSLGKKIALWYTHRAVNLKLRTAEKFAHIIFTAVPESFRLPSKKIHAVGHGIDVDSFACAERKKTGRFTIAVVGRITPIKGCDTIIEAAKILKEKLRSDFIVRFIGAPTVQSDWEYQRKLQDMTRRYNLQKNIEFTGSVPYGKIRDEYCAADVTVNTSSTGGLDKSVLESMAAGVPVVSSHQANALREYFGKYSDALLVERANAEKLADKITLVLTDNEKRKQMSMYLQEHVGRMSDVTLLIQKLSKMMNKL